MPDASTPLTEDNIAEALQAIKDAQPQKRADIVQVFAFRLDAVTERSPTSIDQLSPGSIDAVTLLIPSLLASPTPTLLIPVLLSLIPAQIKLIANNDATPQKDRARLMVQTIMSPLLEKMNDAKDRIHLPAVDNVTSIGLAIFGDSKAGAESVISDSASSFGKGKEKETPQQTFERLLVNAMEGKSSKGKTGGMKVVVGIREKSSALGLRPFMPLLAGFLEDGDSGVREGARGALIALLSAPSTPLSARTELKKLMQARNMKTTTIETMIDQINKTALQLADGSDSRPSPSRNVSGVSMTGIRNRTVSSKSTGIMDDVEIAPVYISTERELESEFAGFLPAFEGKETEHNWLQREKAVEKVRGMLVSGVHRQFAGVFIGCLRASFLTASTKALASLRTTLSVLTIGMYNGLLQELGTSFDPLVDLILGSLAKLAGATKKITAENSQNTIGLIIKKTTCPPKAFISFLSVGVHEKAPQVRGYYARHLKEYLEKYIGARAPAWSGEQVGSVSEMLKHLIGDGTPAVREIARQAFWQFHIRYPNEATALQNSLDDGARKLLDKAKPSPAPATTRATDNTPADPSGASSVSAPATKSEPNQSLPAVTVVRERKPVSTLMAEMKKKKLAAMRAQAAKTSSMEEMLLPETEEKSNPSSSSFKSPAASPSLSPRRASSPEATKSTVSRQSNLSSSTSHQSSPVKPQPGVVSKAQSPAKVPAQIPLPETPTLIELASKRNQRSPRLLSPPQPASNPFEDVFTAPTGTSPINGIEADLAHLNFGSSNGVQSIPSTRADASRRADPIRGSTSPPVPVVPLALTVPSLSEGETATTTLNASVPIARTAARTTSHSSTSGSKVLVGQTVTSEKWDAAAQSYRTPPFVDCSLWLTASRKAAEDADYTDARQTRLSQSIEPDIADRRVSTSTLRDAFALLRGAATSETVQQMAHLRDVDGIRRLMAQEADDRINTAHQTVIANLVEIATRQLSSADDAYREAYVILLWEICIGHRAICNLVDRQIVAGLFEIHQLADDRMRRPVAALLALWGQMAPAPLDLLLCEIAELDRRLEAEHEARWKLLFFGTLAIAVLVLRIPGVVLKEQIPKLRHLVIAGMGASNIAARQAATVLIVAMEANLRDQSALFEMLPGLTEQQKDLAAYMIKQDLPETNKKAIASNGGVEGGLSKTLRRLSAMRL